MKPDDENVTCTCRETSVLRLLGRPIPKLHDCAYVAEREELIPIASRRANERVGTDAAQRGEWTRVFMAEMARLAAPLLAGAKTATVALVLLALGGCVNLMPPPEVIDAMGRDPASVCLRFRATYMAASGDVLIARTNIENGTMRCNDNGISITPGNTVTVDVPPENVTVTPGAALKPKIQPPAQPKLQ